MIRILLVDNHDLVRNGLRHILEDIEDFEVVGEAVGGEQAYGFCRKKPVDIVLMDIQMPGIGGMEATRKITRACKSIKVIALTGSKDELIGRQFLKAGADGFLSKASCATDLVGAVRSVYQGGSYISRDLATRLALSTLQPEKSPFEALTEREFQICLMISDCKKTRDIADSLHIIPKTVNTYRYRIFDKLQVSGDVELVLLAVRYGLVDIKAVASG